MKTKYKRLWIKALLSGKFKQASGVLRNKRDGMCCLGVLRHVMDPKDRSSDGRKNHLLYRQRGETSSSGGIGICGLLFVIFLTLKLIGVAPVSEWSWWWVTAPLWGPIAIVFAIMILVGIGAAIATLVK